MKEKCKKNNKKIQFANISVTFLKLRAADAMLKLEKKTVWVYFEGIFDWAISDRL